MGKEKAENGKEQKPKYKEIQWKNILSQTQKQSQGSGGNSISGYNMVIYLNTCDLATLDTSVHPEGGGREEQLQVDLTGSWNTLGQRQPS